MEFLLAMTWFLAQPAPGVDAAVAYTSVRVESPGDPVKDGVTLLIDAGVVTLLESSRSLDASSNALPTAPAADPATRRNEDSR